ncbi:Chondramide synthase cmdD [Mycobacterium talmoniae]|uniref:Chondramide synthase cmdD n=1 Tax=Mycobacterium talmoniae TaxID=1858794 RepID=A0A2S8BNC1_9MYCO|nr:Chondramide synthase cmdD [Mycobacterium talmoniae]
MDSMVGLLINTVPVRATLTPTTTTADLLDQLQTDHTHTLEHQHLGLNEIHRTTGHERLFDTVLVYENYPVDTAALSGGDGLAITEFIIRDYYHYPLVVQALPGRELTLLVQFRTDVFDAKSIAALVERLRQILAAMTADPAQWLSSIDVLDEHSRLAATTPVPTPEHHDSGDDYRAPASPVEQTLAGIYTEALGVEQVGLDESFFELGGDSLSAMRTIRAINTALDVNLAVRTLFDAPAVRTLSRQLDKHARHLRSVPPRPDSEADG